MKRLWAAGAIFVILAVLCTVGITTTSRLTEEISGTLNEISSAISSGDIGRANSLSQTVIEDWQRCHKTMSTYIPHNKLEEIDQTLATLPPLIETGNEDQAQAECARAVAQVKHIMDTELPTIDNVL